MTVTKLSFEKADKLYQENEELYKQQVENIKELAEADIVIDVDSDFDNDSFKTDQVIKIQDFLASPSSFTVKRKKQGIHFSIEQDLLEMYKEKAGKDYQKLMNKVLRQYALNNSSKEKLSEV